MKNRTTNIDELLAADPQDPGCEATLEVFDLYVEADLAGHDAAAMFPGPTAHLRACPACRADYHGLRAVASELAAG
jgi:hypothetical protein